MASGRTQNKARSAPDVGGSNAALADHSSKALLNLIHPPVHATIPASFITNVGVVIGTKGRDIRFIQQASQCQVTIRPDSSIFIRGETEAGVLIAKQLVNSAMNTGFMFLHIHQHHFVKKEDIIGKIENTTRTRITFYDCVNEPGGDDKWIRIAITSEGRGGDIPKARDLVQECIHGIHTPAKLARKAKIRKDRSQLAHDVEHLNARKSYWDNVDSVQVGRDIVLLV
ncbi:hypothetical protein BC832DRAFT_552616 [Gaertneriomyces semiglobifer]|nr:hypothetical protein BC832DRAFT_552616 [Gaertneriomyces semiglobifer]